MQRRLTRVRPGWAIKVGALQLTRCAVVHMSLESQVETSDVNVHFEEQGSELTVEIGHRSRSPVIVALHNTLLALGIVVSSYQARLVNQGLVERVVLTRLDGRPIAGRMNAETRAAILPIALSADAVG